MAISQYPAASWESHRRKRNCLPEIATAPLGPRNDNSGDCFRFNAALFGSAMQRRARLSLPLQRPSMPCAASRFLHLLLQNLPAPVP